MLALSWAKLLQVKRINLFTTTGIIYPYSHQNTINRSVLANLDVNWIIPIENKMCHLEPFKGSLGCHAGRSTVSSIPNHWKRYLDWTFSRNHHTLHLFINISRNFQLSHIPNSIPGSSKVLFMNYLSHNLFSLVLYRTRLVLYEPYLVPCTTESTQGPFIELFQPKN